MYWPRLILTPEEQKYSTKYFDPSCSGRGVLRRIYQGALEVNETERRPVWNFQIARRCRVMAVTGIGDVHQIRMQFQDASGEQYFVDPVLAASVFGGWAASGISPNAPVTLNPATPAAQPLMGMPFSVAPFVFEPNIVLRPNQVLNIIGEPVTAYNNTTQQAYRIDLAIHVWEFPGYPSQGTGGPAGDKRRNRPSP